MIIDTDDIATAIGQHLLTLSPAIPVVWDGKDIPPGMAHPFLIFDFIPSEPVDNTLNGSFERQTGFAAIAVMTKPGEFASEGRKIGMRIKDLFPYAKKFAITGGKVTINSPSHVSQGYPDGPHFRTPVRIFYSVQ